MAQDVPGVVFCPQRVMANSVVGIFFSVILVAQGKSNVSLASRLWTCLNPSLTIESNMEHTDVNDETCEVKRALGPLFQLSDFEKSVTETKSLVYTLRAVADGDNDQEFPETIKDPIRRWMLNVGIVFVVIVWCGFSIVACILIIVVITRHDRRNWQELLARVATFWMLGVVLTLVILWALVVFSGLLLLLLEVAMVVAGPFLLQALPNCQMDRAIWFCLPVPGSDSAIPINYFLLPSYGILWARQLLSVVIGQRADQATFSLLDFLFHLLDAQSDLSLAWNSWKIVPLWWSFCFFPTVLLSIYSVQSVWHHAPIDKCWWLKLQLSEAIPQVLLALANIWLYARADAPQDPFVVTTIVSSIVKCLTGIIERCQDHEDNQLLSTDSSSEEDEK